MEGEDAAGGGEVIPDSGSVEAAADNPRAFNNKKVWRRTLIVVAGAAMNLVLGFVLLIGYFGICTRPFDNGNVYYAGTSIAQLPETAASYQSGLRPGDTLLKIDGKRVFTVMDIQSLLQDSDDGTFEMLVRRTVDSKTEEVLLPAVNFQRDALESGGYRLVYDFKVNAIPQTVGSTLSQAAKTECSVAVMVWRSLGNILTGKYGLNELSGPIGTVDVIGDVVADAVEQEHWQDGLANVLMLVVLLTVNVGIFNLLPFPALDGGRLLFLIWEGITRKPVPAKYEGWIHAAGLILLLLLVVIVSFSDVFKLFT
jgi:regulator of sigma E protease